MRSLENCNYSETTSGRGVFLEQIIRRQLLSPEALDQALSKLAIDYPQQAELVQLRYFGGLTLEQCAEALGVSARTADTWWAYARAWLALELKPT